ncbi:MAG TPA: dual specificity protein phosphatase 23 [Gemmatales bacterium]|nr:dual specificity protein phosphatase 23 [Gemmatales bacterium]HMP60970.1 dual specificity protein phosphatase 23 [Gemmatales bacterium]
MKRAPFTWIEKPFLAAMARPGRDELKWLRSQGFDVLLSLTEDPPPRRDVDEAGLLLYHVPIQDMTAPTQDDLQRCMSALLKARRLNMAAIVHCEAGLGRTGTVLACWFVQQGHTPDEAIKRIRRLRPGSIETSEQEEAVRQYVPIVLPEV